MTLRHACVVVAILAASSVHATDGRGLAASCAACHGTNGTGAGTLRPLAGRPATELAATLRAWREDPREHAVMRQLARGYSDAEIDALSAWFARHGPRR